MSTQNPNQKLVSVLSIAATALGLLGATAGTALADGNQKIYPGFLCEELVSTGTVTRKEEGVTRTSGAGVATLVCPILRDDLQNNDISVAKVRVTDTLLNATISCSLFARFASGLGAALFQTDDTGAPEHVDSTGELLEFAGGATVPNSYYYIRCSLPTSGAPGSGAFAKIVSYLVGE